MTARSSLVSFLRTVIFQRVNRKGKLRQHGQIHHHSGSQQQVSVNTLRPRPSPIHFGVCLLSRKGTMQKGSCRDVQAKKIWS